MESFQCKVTQSVVIPEIERKIAEHLNNMKRLVLVKVARSKATWLGSLPHLLNLFHHWRKSC